MMLKIELLWILGIFFNIVKGYNNFEGFLHTAEPCFPAHDHPRCSRTLWEAFDAPSDTYFHNTPETLFFLFTPRSPNKAEQLHLCGGNLPPRSTFDPACPTEIFVHGFLDGVCRTAWMREMKEQLFQRKGCYNVILVDWTWGNLINAVLGPLNTKIVGEQIAFVLKNISMKKNYDCKMFHIVGHSYGGTSGSYAGKNMKEECRLGRLTGLDYAFPPFKYTPKEQRFNQDDALFVDAYHANGGQCYPPIAGDSRPGGHVDFYFNDGTFQERSCLPYGFESLLKLDFIYGLGSIVEPNLCAHLQSIQYYKVSILAGNDHSEMVGVRCPNYGDFRSGRCSKDCSVPGNCLVAGMDTPLYINTTDLGPSDETGRIYYVPIASSCPYNDYTGFTGLPLQPAKDLSK